MPKLPSRFKWRFSLRTLVIAMTVACIATPWLSLFLINHYRERKIWNDFVTFRNDRDSALETWRVVNEGNDGERAASAENAYHLAVSKMEASFGKLKRFYDFEPNSVGTFIGADSRIMKAKQAFDPALKSK